MDKDYLINNGVDLNSSLELLGDMSFYNETLQAFLEENQDRVPKIEKYREECNMNDYAILVHALKSDSKYLGFNELAAIAYVHEVAAKANNLEVINARFLELINLINKYTTIANNYLNGGNKKKKVIVADDSIVISNVVEKAFEGKYDVLVAQNGGVAINMIQNNVYDDIVGLILDLNMPDVDGFAVLDYFKQYELFDKIPVFIITGDVEKERIDRAFTYDIIDVIPKPFTLESVRKAMEKVTD
ncbi:MAG: response regulator [Bacilli bacterium]|nr:response regulator [Bacilli bacterium]